MGGNTLKQISCYGLACSLLMEYPGRHLEGECVRILSSHRDIHNDQSTRQNQCTSLADRHQLCGQLRSVEWPVVSSCRPRSLHPTPAATLAAVVSSCSKPHSRSKRLWFAPLQQLYYETSCMRCVTDDRLLTLYGTCYVCVSYDARLMSKRFYFAVKLYGTRHKIS